MFSQALPPAVAAGKGSGRDARAPLRIPRNANRRAFARRSRSSEMPVRLRRGEDLLRLGAQGAGGVEDRLAQLLHGAYLDLTHPLARDVELVAQRLQRHRLLAQAPLQDDLALAVGEAFQRLVEQLAAQGELVRIREQGLLARAVVAEQFHPLGVAIGADRDVERTDRKSTRLNSSH